jgi:DNA-binding transcriptional LysR family regulator
MEFSQLRIFQAVAEEGSITRAAERLHRVPSNLSTRLRQLEEQLGVELFLRERQRLQLSPAGKVLLDYANRLSACVTKRWRRAGGQPAGDFVLGTMYSTAAVHLPALLARYHQAYPAVNLQVQAAPAASCWRGCSTIGSMLLWWTGRRAWPGWMACRCAMSSWC